MTNNTKISYDHLFYPQLKRRQTYLTHKNSSNFQYNSYKEQIEQDCKHRCVYCDITYCEIGFEGMVLDHFRPQRHFPALCNNPYNLVLSCPKCNRLKSDLWPAGVDCPETFKDNCGFVDPFIESMQSYFSIKTDGMIEPLRPPATYLEKVLHLNRYARKQVRYLRIITSRIEQFRSQLEREFIEKSNQHNEQKITDADFIYYIKEYRQKLELMRNLNSKNKQ